MTTDAVPPAKQEPGVLGPGVTTALGKVGAARTLGKSCILVMASLSIMERYRNPIDSHQLREGRVTLLKQFLLCSHLRAIPDEELVLLLYMLKGLDSAVSKGDKGVGSEGHHSEHILPLIAM